MSKKFNLTIRMGAAHHDVIIETERGTSKLDMTTQNKHQKNAVRELIVDSFCVHSLCEPVYA